MNKLHRLVVDKRSKDQVNMIWHHHRDFKVEVLSIVMKAAVEND